MLSRICRKQSFNLLKQVISKNRLNSFQNSVRFNTSENDKKKWKHDYRFLDKIWMEPKKKILQTILMTNIFLDMIH